MSKAAIAKAEGIDERAVRGCIERALRNIEKYLKKRLATDGVTEAQIKRAFPTNDALTEYAREEVVANSASSILTDPETGKAFSDRFLAEDADTRTAFGKLLDSILNFMRQAYEAFSEQKSWQQMRSLEQDIEAISKIREAYFSALEGLKEQNGKATDESEHRSIKYDIKNRPFVEVDDDILSGVPKSNWVSTAKRNLVKKFPNGVTIGGNAIAINEKSRREMTFSKYAQWLMKNDPALFADKLRATNNADEILRAFRSYVNEALLHPRKDDIREFARGEVLLRVGNNDYDAMVIVGTTKNGYLLLYDVINLRPTTIDEKQQKGRSYQPTQKRGRQKCYVQ